MAGPQGLSQMALPGTMCGNLYFSDGQIVWDDWRCHSVADPSLCSRMRSENDPGHPWVTQEDARLRCLIAVITVILYFAMRRQPPRGDADAISGSGSFCPQISEN